MRTALVDQRSAHDFLLMRPRAAGQASRWDLDAAELLERNEAQRLELIRGRAEKWAGALTALTGLLSAVRRPDMPGSWAKRRRMSGRC